MISLLVYNKKNIQQRNSKETAKKQQRNSQLRCQKY